MWNFDKKRNLIYIVCPSCNLEFKTSITYINNCFSKCIAYICSVKCSSTAKGIANSHNKNTTEDIVEQLRYYNSIDFKDRLKLLLDGDLYIYQIANELNISKKFLQSLLKNTSLHMMIKTGEVILYQEILKMVRLKIHY